MWLAAERRIRPEVNGRQDGVLCCAPWNEDKEVDELRASVRNGWIEQETVEGTQKKHKVIAGSMPLMREEEEMRLRGLYHKSSMVGFRFRCSWSRVRGFIFETRV
jgi:hypothetical protein